MTEEGCRAIYGDTRPFYERMAPVLGERALGFRILYGPPVIAAPILFLGYQPGGSLPDCEKTIAAGDHETWPERCDYCEAPWLLAERIRAIWDLDVLSGSTGLNINFFRSPSVKAWHKVPKAHRAKIEEFCLDRAERIVRALRPRLVVVIGLKTFQRITDGPVAYQDGQRVLARTGDVWGSPAVGVLHLSGAIMRSDARSAFAGWLKASYGQKGQQPWD